MSACRCAAPWKLAYMQWVFSEFCSYSNLNSTTCTITWHRQKPSHLATVHEADTCVGGRTKESLLFMTAVVSDCCSWINPPNTRVGSPACNHHVSVSLSRSTRNGCTGTWITKTNIQELKPKSIRRWGIKKMCSGFYGKLTRPWF